ncbi:hypothetical protein, partial [Xanthomonas hortorum]
AKPKIIRSIADLSAPSNHVVQSFQGDRDLMVLKWPTKNVARNWQNQCGRYAQNRHVRVVHAAPSNQR